MTVRRSISASRIICAALLVVFAIVLRDGLTFPHDAALFPTIAGSLGLILTVLLLIVDRGTQPAAAQHPSAGVARTAIALLAAPVYSALVWLVGFYIASFTALAVLPWVLGFRRPVALLLIAIGGVAVLAALFAGAMSMSLPQGLLGEWFLYRFVYDR